MSQPPPPFLLPQRPWSRAGALLAGAGRQRVVVAVLALAALLAAGVVWVRATPHPGSGREAEASALTDQAGQGVAGGSGATGAEGAAAGPGQILPRAAPGTSAGSDPSGRLTVHVAGHVRHPGLVRLPAGSRVHDAIRAAGGVTSGADLDAVNLARKLLDGEQVLIPGPGDPPPPLAPGAGPAGGPTAPLDLNTATVEQLDALPGIGEVTAGHIVAYRSAQAFYQTGPRWDRAGGAARAGVPGGGSATAAERPQEARRRLVPGVALPRAALDLSRPPGGSGRAGRSGGEWCPGRTAARGRPPAARPRAGGGPARQPRRKD
jgi:competence protein ComEA